MLKTDYRDNVLTAYIDGEIDHDATSARCVSWIPREWGLLWGVTVR